MPDNVLDQALESPSETVESARLPEVWRQLDIRFECGWPGWLDHPWRLPSRLRGAIGQQMHRSASPQARDGLPCPWRPPSSWDVFFRDRRVSGLRQPLAKPWVISAEGDAGRARLAITIRLFGWAGEWAGEVAEAATQALSGAAPGGEAQRRLALDIRGREMGVWEGAPDLDWPPGVPALVVFQTPVVFRAGQRAHPTLAGLPLRLADRLQSLAPWMGVRLTVEAAALKRLESDLERDERGLQPWRGWRGSVRQPRPVPVEGRVGSLLLGPPPAPLLPLLVLGQWTHVGSHAALGQGRYRVSPVG
ncbi:CRISPR system precrRNA processing endoribonuclease RAMP protein Cas6 [Roseospirillum parvum]|uniref:Uncharacterized conserved protein n=1 Tax=Roseospirillum parvum TaxID=83401 RepID=A0A1G8FC87_9PROT|nr:CRISPR system precrRNA processing endoribonuclease RAMP protein Cas6 [Roseospirillum parvum]SDH79750.1 Uncharacterized conserved protein [Roseospirillum parvum]